MRGKILGTLACFCLPLEAYHILLSSITTIVFTPFRYMKTGIRWLVVSKKVKGNIYSPSSDSSVSSPTSSSSLSSSCTVTCSTSLLLAFNDKSTNSGLAAGELLPDLHISSKSLTVATHALYSSPELTVTFGNVATYSIRWLPPSLAFNGTTSGPDASNNFTFAASSFAVTIAITSPLDSSTPNIVIMTLKMSSPCPVCACTGVIVMTVSINDARITTTTPISNKTVILFCIYISMTSNPN